LTGEEKEHRRRRLSQVSHLPPKIRTGIKKKGRTLKRRAHKASKRRALDPYYKI